VWDNRQSDSRSGIYKKSLHGRKYHPVSNTSMKKLGPIRSYFIVIAEIILMKRKMLCGLMNWWCMCRIYPGTFPDSFGMFPIYTFQARISLNHPDLFIPIFRTQPEFL